MIIYKKELDNSGFERFYSGIAGFAGVLASLKGFRVITGDFSTVSDFSEVRLYPWSSFPMIHSFFKENYPEVFL